MKILYVNDFDYVGGAETVMHQLANYMKNRGHDVHFAFGIISKKGECFHIPHKKRRTLFGRIVPFWNVKDPEVYRATRKLIGKIKPDLIHFHKLELLTLAPLIAAKKQNIPRLMTVHDAILICHKHYRLKLNEENCKEVNWNNCSPTCSRRKAWALKYEMRKRFKILQDELVVTPSEYLKNVYTSFGWQGKILTIPNGVETKLFEPAYSPSKTVIWIGRASREKGPKYFIKAAELVKKKHPKANFLMISDAKDKDAFQSNAVKSIGWVSREQLIKRYANSLMLVMTSLFEASPLAVLEAMACGKPVIGFDVGGLKEMIVDGISGFLVEPKNCTELADKILLLLRDQNLAVRLGKKARERVEKEFRIEDTARKYEQLYEEICT